MEFENREPKNERPEEASSMARYLLIGLAACIAGILLYGYFSNNTEDKQVTTDLDSITTADTTTVATAQPVTATPTVETATAVSKPAETEVTVPVVEVPSANSASATAKPTVKEEKTLPTKTANVSDLKGETRSHVVGAGETFLGIANRYNLKMSTLQALNPGVSPDGIKQGATKLNVKVQGTHVVGAGDILRVVAKKYNVTVEQLMAVNKKAKNVSTRGEELIIPVAKKQ